MSTSEPDGLVKGDDYTVLVSREALESMVKSATKLGIDGPCSCTANKYPLRDLRALAATVQYLAGAISSVGAELTQTTARLED